MRAQSAAEIDSEEFTERIRRRDPDALRAVTLEYLSQVVRAARGAGLPLQRAEDVAQSTFETFIKVAPRFEGRSRVRTWLFGILYKKIAEERRSESRDERCEDIDAVMDRRFTSSGRWAAPPDARLRGAEIRDGIETCLEALPNKQRMAFMLREAQAFGTEEVCKILDVTPTNLGVLLHRARNNLRECLERRGLRDASRG